MLFCNDALQICLVQWDLLLFWCVWKLAQYHKVLCIGGEEKWVSFYSQLSAGMHNWCLSDGRRNRIHLLSSLREYSRLNFPHMLGKWLPKGNLILGHKHTGGCGRTKFTKKWKHAVGVEWWNPKERNSITTKEVTAAKHIHVFIPWKSIMRGIGEEDGSDIQWWELKQRNTRKTMEKEWAGKWEGGRGIVGKIEKRTAMLD